jgi:hypothetical protein
MSSIRLPVSELCQAAASDIPQSKPKFYLHLTKINRSDTSIKNEIQGKLQTTANPNFNLKIETNSSSRHQSSAISHHSSVINHQSHQPNTR